MFDQSRCLLHDATLAEINSKLDRVLVAVEGDNDHVGLKLEVDRLNGTARRTTKMIWLLIAAAVTAIVERLF